MASPRLFANYPGAREATDISYDLADQAKNPVLRGLPLAIGAAIVTRSIVVQRFLYGNAGFDKLSAVESLNDEPWRFDPTVIPLRDPSTASISEPTFEPELLKGLPADTPGRYASFADYHNVYLSGAATPVQVVEALLPLIRRDVPSPTPYSKAWLDIHVDDVLAAARASAERYASGKPLGVLDGIPFGVKADLPVRGYLSTYGMRVDPSLSFFRTPETDTLWPVQKLEEAGAIMLGKMNQHEIGMDTTGCNPVTGTPVNFCNPAYYPGGSSSGAGSALGAGLVPLCVGTDAGGSIRVPAATAGCVSLKTSHNRTCVMTSSMCIVGPMCANVTDLTVAYRIMAQPDTSDPVSGLFAPSEKPAAQAGAGGKRYLGLCRPWVNRATPEVRALFDKAVAWYEQELGYEVIDIDIPLIAEGRTAHGAINLAEAADKARARVSPAADGAAAAARWTDLLSPANAITCCVGAQTTAGDYLRFAQVRSALMRHLAFLFERYGARLLIVSPTLPDAGYAVSPGDEARGFTDGDRTMRSMLFVWLSNMTGCPSATVPVGYVPPEKGHGKLPVGMLAMGMWGEEENVLGWAADGEKYLREGLEGGRVRPEAWVDVIGLAKEGKTFN
ncbi:amidase signature enzyme [Cryphonectria parasitica EP155]|uniref:Amidase signature enzyme n=1 Tax=Cryphonectria parasitica (strain ATCC 38755 / EP155) TaxID=660469 RepID=A0A9P4Y1C5_CRYP1|nr:amidase signature enzyme [Cryphonectria parasitica EP155]KAF3764577.1 amidase signature enzyme [Cryphonectria parasitica EP155]